MLQPPEVEATLSAAADVQATTMAYVGTLINPRNGKFNVARAKAAGVPKGPMWGLLGRGECVTLDDGRVVQPEDVLDPVDPLPHFAIVHVPERASLLALLATDGVFDEFCSLPSKCPTVVHFAPQHVVQLDEYARVLQRFGENVTHVFVDPDSNTIATTTASTKFQVCLGCVCVCVCLCVCVSVCLCVFVCV